MAPSKKNKKPDYRTLLLRIIVIAILAGVCYNLTVGKYGFLGIIQTKTEISQLKQQEKLYTVELVDLESTIDRLQTDTLYIERLARKHFQLGREEETVVQF